ncbi:30S ribosomal protein S16 [Candidatus Falkowbacteria bacterium CG10_big_fil_rev_8_21_14_0_10_39_9]|uniref:Small ribosomal subunit protein bS16 n=1 Tax=Candidatus Falkowbacteria bacterium CG10_big_fil_rev_8_21_14_0_10_39_9 TaxID=1974566 RepID=A0A2M6WQN6_9BACT|nr:MAG: 30S ribosomal protein S16 [Candidatus Falkowbacteria bacterium CG10_big_fil_rev_8_21_14_0_10_39_9]
MLTIRLSQVGKKNKKMFRLIVSEKTKDPFGDCLEILGSYNPHSKDLQVKADRVKHWIENGAELSPTVNNLLIEKKVITGKKLTSSSISKNRTEKMNKKQEENKKAAADKVAKKRQLPLRPPKKQPLQKLKLLKKPKRP